MDLQFSTFKNVTHRSNIYIKINWREEIDFTELREHIKYIPIRDYCLLVVVILYLSFDNSNFLNSRHRPLKMTVIPKKRQTGKLVNDIQSPLRNTVSGQGFFCVAGSPRWSHRKTRSSGSSASLRSRTTPWTWDSQLME